ncbi:MAG: T9SS type B sorting domain-containing protein [Bacteroidetes bacterium]|nr:hypothetical protein [Bacteroidota bacterium]MCL4816355.1 gliding motility-associated C-terminal domain-containing protein [Flavobacteriales bacterium]NOG95317.1 T9SS type B sorting domain-containing protein [Bacteroidota bacterium]GIK69602.1 MAG: hypothetical protein BroJett020_08970 [Bacteroidota bacterium]CAG0999820.1 hypothetical protein FLAV_02875 [Flavobacteriales bacterium]
MKFTISSLLTGLLLLFYNHTVFAVCDTLNNPPFGSLSLVSLQIPNSGYMAGNNSTGNKSMAERFSSFGSLTHVTGGRIYFGHIKEGGNNATVQFKIWDNTGSGGKPGNVLAVISVPLADLDANIPNNPYPSGGGFFEVIFPSSVAITPTFYFGITMLNFGNGDTLGIVSNSPGNSFQNSAWTEGSNNVWQSFSTAYSISTLSLFISPYMTNIPAHASITANPLSICQGQNVFFSASASQNAQNYEWQFAAGNPSTSSNTNQVVNYTSSGTWKTFLTAKGVCHSQHIDSISITVNDNPQLSLSGLGHVLCNGANTGFVSVSATGAGGNYTYSWNTNPVQTNDTAFNLSGGAYTVTVTGNNGCSSQLSATVNEPSAISVSFSSTTSSCTPGNDGTATANPSGGVPGYLYNWNTFPTQTTQTATNLNGNTTYLVTITDQNGCNKLDSVFVSNFSNLLSTTFTTTSVSCFGGNNGTATVNVSGGSGNYSYLWNTNPLQTTQTATGLSAGSYSVTVTDNNNGCTKIAIVSISQPSAISLSASSTPISCAGGTNGTTTVIPSGGTAPYSYSWTSIPPQYTQTATNLPGGTYTCTITDAKGCVDSINATVNQPAPISAFIISSSNPQCAMGLFNGQAVAGANGGTGNYTFTWNTNPIQINDTAFNVGPGTWKVYVTDQNNCMDSATVTLTAPGNQPNVSIVSKTNNICFGGNNGTATTSASGGTPPYSYLWNTIPPQFGGVAVNLPAGTFKVTLTDVNGCEDTAFVTISQGVQITATFNTTPENCGAGNGTATVFPSGGTPGYTYSWNTNPIQTTQTAINLSQGTYTVTITDNAGCTANHNVNVWNTSGGITTTKMFTPVLCNGDSNGTATVTPSGGTPGYLYLWNTNPVQTTPTATNLKAGSYIVKTTDQAGCSVTDTIIVTEPLPLNLNPNSQNTICAANNGMAIVEPTGGSGGYTFLWTPGNQTTSSINNLSAGLYKVVVTDANGCKDSTVITISQLNNSITSNTFVIDTITCFGGNNGSAYAVPTNGTGPYSFTWNTVPSQNNDTAFNMPAGIFTVTILDVYGCVGINTVTVHQAPEILLNINSINNTDSINCNGAASVVVNGGTPGYSYTWTPGGQNTPSIGNLCKGNYCVIVTDVNNCSKNICTFIQGPSPCNLSINLNTTDATCFGTNTGTASATTNGGTPPYTEIWRDLNGTPVNPNALFAGLYTLLVIDDNGCTDSVSFIISNPTSIIADVFVTHNICFGGNTGTALITNISGGTGPYTVSPSSPVNNLSAGNYSFTVTDNNGCQQSFPFTILQGIEISITSNSMPATCTLSDGVAFASASGGQPPYTYWWNDADSTQNNTLFDVKAGTYLVTVTDSNNCSNTASVTIQSINNITSKTETTPESCTGFFDGTATVAVTYGLAPYTFSWSNSVAEQSISGLKTGIYTVIIRDARGCIGKDTALVDLENNACINIPNAFTPNGDGTNEYWRIKGSEAYPDIKVEVLNRWGSILFSSSNGYKVPWDGRYNGKEVAPGVYYYIINLGDGSNVLTGSVTIIR